MISKVKTMSAADHVSQNAPHDSQPFPADIAARANHAWDQTVAFYEASKEPNSKASDLLATGFIVLTGLYSLAVLVSVGLRLSNQL